MLPCVRDRSLDCALTFQLFHWPTQRPPVLSLSITHKHTLTPLLSAFPPSQASRDQQEAEKCEWKKKKYTVCVVVRELWRVVTLPVSIWASVERSLSLWVFHLGHFWSQNGREEFSGCVLQRTPFLYFEIGSLRQNKQLLA